jgi:hypothetical protein
MGPMKEEIEGGREKASQFSKTLAVRQVEQFCLRTGMEQSHFMSAIGWLGEGRWAKAVDWKGMNWPNFKKLFGSQRWSKGSAKQKK